MFKAVWRKPGDEATAFGEPIGADEEHALAMMRALAQTIVSEDRINPWGLASAIIGRLKSLAIATSTARLNVQRINGWLADAPIFQWMSRQGSMVGVPANNWAVPMIRGRSRSHPLKWMILWTSAWRSEGVDEAVAAFQLAARGLATHENGTQFLLWPDDWGRPTDTGVPAEVEEAFLSCQTIQEVAMALSSSTGAVKKLLTDYPRFGRVWMKNVREQRIHRARENMHRELAANPSVTRSELQRRCKTDVEWLSRNAPITLRSILARLPARKGPQGELF